MIDELFARVAVEGEATFVPEAIGEEALQDRVA